MIVSLSKPMTCLVAAVLLLGAAAGAAGCGSDDNLADDAAAATDGGQIDCAAGTLNVAGNSSLKRAWSAWVEAYQRECADATLNYDGQGSGYGRTQFVQKQVPLASSLAALAGDQRTQARQRCAPGAAVDLPMTVIPISLAYHLDGVDKLTLTPELFARIFEGKITRWNDPQLAAVNPGVALPDKSITPVYFSADAGTSENITRLLVTQVPQEWPHKPSQSWPNSIGIGAAISTTIVSAIKNTDGALGYVDYPDAVDNKLTLAALDSGAGPVTISPATVRKALDAANVNQDGQDTTLDLAYGLDAGDAYPAIMVSYMITCTEPGSNLVKSFLTFTASDEGQRLSEQLHYIPLPDELRRRVQAVVAQLKV
jgi:phosphate transport system substrate-binding protein